MRTTEIVARALRGEIPERPHGPRVTESARLHFEHDLAAAIRRVAGDFYAYGGRFRTEVLHRGYVSDDVLNRTLPQDDD